MKLLLLRLSTSGPTRTNLHMPGVDKQGARMPLIRQRRDQGRPRPAVNTPSNFAMRLTIGSLFVLFLAFAWAGMGSKQESARTPATSQFPDLYEASITELQHGLGKGLFTSVDLVKASQSLSLSCGRSGMLTWLSPVPGLFRKDRGSESTRTYSPRRYRDEPQRAQASRCARPRTPHHRGPRTPPRHSYHPQGQYRDSRQ